MSSVVAMLSEDSRGHRSGSGLIEISTDEIGEIRGGWLPVAGLVLGIAGRALGGWRGALVNRAGFGLAVFETARWLGGGGEQYGGSGSPRE
jgi:hypothetical protein